MRKPLLIAAAVVAVGSAVSYGAPRPAAASPAFVVAQYDNAPLPLPPPRRDDRYDRPDGGTDPGRRDLEEAPPPYAMDERTHMLNGFVESYGGVNLQLRMRGGVYPVKLHKGTEINPRGATLRPGTRVTVFGIYANGVYNADRINIVY